MTLAKPRISLRHRISIGLLLYAAALTLVLVTAGVTLSEHHERRVWRALLADVMQRDLHAAGMTTDDAPAIATIRLIDLDSPAARTLPVAVRELGPGLHDDIEPGNLPYAVLVQSVHGRRMAALVDIAAQQAEETHVARLIAFAMATGLVLLLLLTWWLAGRLLAPVSALVRSVDALDPLQRERRVTTAFRQHEIAALETAFNRFLERVDGFVMREREFIDTVSHELRTPIAVIGGGTELLEDEALTPRGQQALARIRGASASMQDTVTALLYLAKDPVAFAPVQPWRLDGWLPAVIEDHRHLKGDKPLRIEVDQLEATSTRVPPVLAGMVIGNLIRNAIEHTASGELHVALHDRALILESHGAEVDAATISRLYRALTTTDTARAPSAGIGLYLIRRLCDRLGWRLAFDSVPNGDLRVRLDMPADGPFA